MALLADPFAQIGRQSSRIDYGLIRARRNVGPLLFLNVQFSRTVAALAADGESVENRLLIMIQGVLNGIGPIAMTKQAVSRDRPAGKERLVEPGRQIPNLLLRKPADGGLEEEAVALNQVGPALRA